MTVFSRVPLGGGGFVTDIKISSDGLTRVHKTDVSPGAYIWRNDQWESLFDNTSMAGTEYVQGNWGEGFNCHDIAFSPSDPTRLYMLSPSLVAQVSRLFVSTDRGTTWTVAACAGSISHSQGDSYRFYGDKSAVDPFDPDHYIWTANAGSFFRTTNAGATQAQISTGSVPLGYPNAVAFDPTTEGVAYLHSYGNGLYKSVDSGSTWAAVPGAPTTCRRMVCDPTGRLWITEDAAGTNLWRLVGGTWTNMSPSWADGWYTVAVNPLDDDQITLGTAGGNINHSYDGGATWTDAYDNAGFQLATDIPWMAAANEDYMSNSQMAYDPIVSNRLWSAAGIGLWYTTPLTDFSKPTWYELTRGNDELIVQHIVKLPGARPCIVSTQDRAIFALDGENYPASQLHDPAVPIRHGGSIDYCATDPDFFVAIISGGVSGGNKQISGWSDDAGTTFTEFVTQPAIEWGGCICVSATDKDNLLYVPAANGIVHYSTNRGDTWTASTFGGITGATTPNPASYATKQIIACSDRVTGGTFYIMNLQGDGSGGVYKSTNGGASFARVEALWTPYGGGGSKLSSVPGHAGHLFWSLGASSPHPYNPEGTYYPSIFRRSEDGGDNWTDLGNGWGEVHSHGFGKEAPGASYPTIFVSGARFGDTPGIYYSTDECATWTRMGDDYKTWDFMGTLSGDMDVYGDVWVGLTASGVVKGELSEDEEEISIPVTSLAAMREIADLDATLAEDGQDVVLYRVITSGATQTRLAVDVRAFVRPYRQTPDEVASGIVQDFWHVIMSPSEIIAADWPGSWTATPSEPIQTDLDRRVPRSGDKVVFAGRARNVEFAAPFYIDNALCRIELWAKG